MVVKYKKCGKGVKTQENEYDIAKYIQMIPRSVKHGKEIDNG